MKKTLKNVCDFFTGTGFPVIYQGKTDGELPFYKVGDVANNVINGHVYLKLCKNYISRKIAKDIKGIIVPKDTIVFAKIGEALKLNRRSITSTECLIDNNMLGICPKNQIVRTKYFYYFLKQLKMQNLAETTTVPSVKKSTLENVIINIPPLQNQLHIENILNTVSNIISNYQKELTQLDLLTQSLFVEMFINENYPKKKLGECAIINPKKSSDKRLHDELEVSFVPMMAVGENGQINVSEIKKFADVKNGFTYFSEGDVLFAKITPCMENGKGAIASNLCNGIGFGSTEFHVIRAIENITTSEWIYVLTTLQKFRLSAEANMTGSAGQKRVPASFLQDYSFYLPPIELQKQFSRVFKHLDKHKLPIIWEMENIL